MNDRMRLGFLWGAAAAAMLAGVVVTGLTLHALTVGRARLERVLNETAALRQVEQKLGGSLAAKAAFDALPSAKPAALVDTVKRLLPECKLEEGKETRQETVPGWIVRRQEIGLGDVPFGKVMDLVREAGAQRPPWSLVKLTLRASSREPGVGQAVLVMEGLEKP